MKGLPLQRNQTKTNIQNTCIPLFLTTNTPRRARGAVPLLDPSLGHCRYLLGKAAIGLIIAIKFQDGVISLKALSSTTTATQATAVADKLAGDDISVGINFEATRHQSDYNYQQLARRPGLRQRVIATDVVDSQLGWLRTRMESLTQLQGLAVDVANSGWGVQE